jgi:hypothetical protein
MPGRNLPRLGAHGDEQEHLRVGQAPRRLSPAHAAGDDVLPSRGNEAPPLLQRLQGATGNRATAALIQRDRRQTGAPAKDAGPSLAAFDAANPGIVAALSYEQLKIWHDVIDGWTANRKVDEALVRHEKHERSTFLDPSSTAPIASSDYLDEHARIESRRKFVDEGKSKAALSPAAILSPDIGAAQAWNVDAEQRYRAWAIQHFSSKPLVAELTSKREIVSALEESQNPGLQSGIPHVNLLWGGFRIKHTKGTVTWDDLMDMREFRDKYVAEVSDSPSIKALRLGIIEIESHISLMKLERQERSDKNAEHGVVRHISEALGGPSGIELAALQIMAKQKLGTLSKKEALALQATIAEREAEAGDYPKLKDNESGPGIWHDPELQLAAARRFQQEGKIELAVAALNLCEQSTTVATARFAGYERRVMKGAGTAVKWLERAKTAGKIASAFTGTGGVIRSAIGAAGYTFAQEGSEQVVAHWIDPSNKIDLAGLTEQAAIEGLAGLFGGLTQGAFVEALTARFGARLVTKYGLSEGAARTVLSAAGATTSSFYNVPAKMALDKIISGKAFPQSLAEVCTLVTDSAVESGLMDTAGSFVHAHSATAERAPDPAAPHAGPEITGTHEVVEALAGPEGAALTGERPSPMSGGIKGPEPTTIMAEARMIAGNLEPLRQKWGDLSPKERAQQLIDAVHGTLAAKTGVPKPDVKLAGIKGGLFYKETWHIEIDASVVGKKNPSIDEFAWACEIARHEMEHAIQFFRVAKREYAMTGKDAQTLSDSLRMPKERMQEAIESKIDPIHPGSEVDRVTAAIRENVYDVKKGARRNEILTKLNPAIEALKIASDTFSERMLSETDPTLVQKASDEWQAVETKHRPIVEEYRNFPEEVPAYAAGGEVAAAVKEQARLADAVHQARQTELRAYDGIEKARREVRSALAKPGVRVPATTRATLLRAVKEWTAALQKTTLAEQELIRVLEGRK